MKIHRKLLTFIFIYLMFPQKTYELESFDVFFEWAEFKFLNPTYVEGQINVSKVTRTTKGLYVTFTLFKDFPPETTIVIQMYGYFSNEYRKMPVHIVRNMCGFFANEFHWFKDQVLDAPNKMPVACPITKGNYYLWGFVPKSTGIPVTANMPWTKIKIKFKFNVADLNIVNGNVYMTLDHDANIRKAG